ncbi:MAG: response regulator, partial [Arcobacteraceae bacterium]
MEADVSRLKDITVLYCEDEEYLRDITKGILESFTKKQFICKDGAEGLEVFKENQHLIDLVITDVNMPNMNGLEMAKEIKKINSNMPIIVATAFSNSEYLLEAIDLGVDKYVLKPINVKKLLDIMSKSLLYHELRDLYLDQLTRLQNRNALIKDTKVIATSTLALINIDKFSILNDLYGEDFGDQILLAFVSSVKDTFDRELYNIYRVGSDNFVVLCNEQNTDIKEFSKICKNFINHTTHNGLEIGGENIDISITIGIAQSNDKHAFEYAQRAIPKARKRSLDILEYDKEQFEQKKDIEENIAWIKKLKNGLTDGKFQPYFQPIIDAQTKEIYKYEALIRYIDEDGTEVAPYKFLTIAKKARLFPVIIKVMLS